MVAYPTEGVYGFGCLPDDPEAVFRILGIKQRDPLQGLLLIAADLAQLDGWIDLPAGVEALPGTLAKPVTWIVPATDAVPLWIRGRHAGVGVRITAHPVAAALCRVAGSALVSTSANIAGRPPLTRPWPLRRQFRKAVDAIVPGACGPASGPSEIRTIGDGSVLRSSRQRG